MSSSAVSPVSTGHPIGDTLSARTLLDDHVLMRNVFQILVAVALGIVVALVFPLAVGVVTASVGGDDFIFHAIVTFLFSPIIFLAIVAYLWPRRETPLTPRQSIRGRGIRSIVAGCIALAAAGAIAFDEDFASLAVAFVGIILFGMFGVWQGFRLIAETQD